MKNVKINIGKHKADFNQKMLELKEKNIIQRIWEKDHTVWRKDPTEISNRLGWLDCSNVAKTKMAELTNFAEEIKGEGFTHALLLGMGGSSLAPEVFRKIFGVKSGFLDLSVLDSTHPDQVSRMLEKFNSEKTLFIVSTKSGGTVETISFMKRFYNTTISSVGKANVGQHFVAITDPNSGLEQMAKDLNFRKVFINDPNIGGRYSALSLFGLVPAALIGVELNGFIKFVDEAIEESKDEENLIAQIGVALGVLANKGVDKATFILTNKLKPFGAWVEQLIAESTGKDGKGILPVESEEVLMGNEYSNDRVFIFIKTEEEQANTEIMKEFIELGFPVIEITLNSIDELGAQFFAWEMATVIASWVIDIQPFDQPNVEEAKIIARKMMSDYFEKGELANLTPILEENRISVYGSTETSKIVDVIPKFMAGMEKGIDDIKGRSYVAIQAYVEMNDDSNFALHKLRTKIQNEFKVATTVGFGPRFLHSTGQLHKGDAGNGLFIQIVSQNKKDVDIPNNAGDDEASITFKVLLNAQALGDRAALLDNNRRVVRFDISEYVADDISKLM